MPKFDSPIGSKQIQGQPMREFSVPDESEGAPPILPHMPRRHEPPAPPQFDPAAMRDFQEAMQPRPNVTMKELNEVEQRIYEAKKAKREGKDRLSDGARRRIEMLIEMTRATREVEIGGNLYRLQSLSSVELRDATTATAEFDGSVQFIFEIRKQLLARSLTVVAGVESTQFLNSNDLQDRLDFIELMDHALLLRLYNEYNILAKEVQDRYAIKSEQEVKEVVEDLKK